MRLHHWLLTAVLAALPIQAHAEPSAGGCPEFASQGSGPDIVLVPGLGSSPRVWDGVVEQLSAEHRVHRVHIAGFAGRPAEGNPDGVIDRAANEVLAYLDCQAIESVAYVGHSLGGFLGLKLAAQHPSRIQRLVVVDALPFFPLIFSPDATEESARGQAQAIRQQVLAQSDAAFERNQRAGIRSLVQSADNQQTVVSWTLASDRATFAGAMHTLMTTDMRSSLSAITAPTTVIAAANAFAPRARVEALYSHAYAELDTIDLAIIDDSFHFIMLDQPARFSSTLSSALTSPCSVSSC